MSLFVRKKTVPAAHGFTLVELLTVITIILIMSAILVPVISGSMVKARMTRSMSDGRSIYQVLFANHDRNIYPASQGENAFANSTDFFKSLVEDRTLDVTYDFFSAHGLEEYKGLNSDKFTDEHNAWCIVADIGASVRSMTPLLFTRNLEINALDAPLDGALTDKNPYGQHGAVVVRMGGASQIIKAEDLEAETFNPDEAINTVLRP